MEPLQRPAFGPDSTATSSLYEPSRNGDDLKEVLCSMLFIANFLDLDIILASMHRLNKDERHDTNYLASDLTTWVQLGYVASLAWRTLGSGTMLGS